MKKSLIVLSALAAASAVAFADTNVSLYGQIDVGPVVTKAKGKAATVSLDSSNYSATCWGITGTEDLGAGNQIGFQLEQGFGVDTGAGVSTRAFHRVSRLFVQGDWGHVGFGRFGALSAGTGPYQMMSGAVWLSDGTTSFGETNQWDTLGGTAVRGDNAVVYVSPEFGGFQFKAMYSNKINSETVDDSANKWSENNHYYGVGASYNASNLNVVLTFDVRDQKGLGGISALEQRYKDGLSYRNLIEKPIYNLNFGVGYDFGAIYPQIGYSYITQSDVATQHMFALSASSPIAGGKLAYGARYIMGSMNGFYKQSLKAEGEDSKYRILTINAFYNYPLNKRTSVYGYAGWTKGFKLYKETGETPNVIGGDTMNTNGYSIQFGMVHSF